MGRYQRLGLPTGGVIFLVGVWLALSTRNSSNLHYTGLIAGGLLFTTGVILVLLSYMY